MAYSEFKELHKDSYQLRKCMQMARNISGHLLYVADADLEGHDKGEIEHLANHISSLIADIEGLAAVIDRVANGQLEQVEQ